MSTGDFNDNFLANLLERINREFKRLILLGDFNINLLSYKENKDVKSFVDILQSSLITPTINLPTRITSQSSTCLLYTSPSPRDATLSRMPSSA